MKTPKRHIELTTMIHDGMEMVWDNSQWNISTQRWKRKNKIAQLKRTIARLTQELKREREYRRSMLSAYASLAEIARNAKQSTFAFTDAEQLTERKEKP